MQRVSFEFELSNEDRIAKAELFEKLKKNEIVQKWLDTNSLDDTFLEKHVYKFKEYVERKQKCLDCHSLNQCMQDNKGYILELEYDRTIMKNLNACRYKKEELEKYAHKKQFLICDMSEEQLLYSFKNIDLENEKLSYIELVAEMVDSCQKDSKEGYFLCGDTGSGKTYLSCCFVNEMAKKGKKCVFVNVAGCMNTLKKLMYDKEAYSNYIDSLRKADVVVFDDIGGESVSNWTRDEILLPILNERMEKGRLTLFTSNYNFVNLEKYYALNSKLINDQVGAKRLVERMKALSKEKVVKCPNRRLKNGSIL